MGLDIFLCLFLFLPPIENINLKLEGLIDLGPKWNFKYSLIPLRDNDETEPTGPVVPIKDHATEPTRPLTTEITRSTTPKSKPSKSKKDYEVPPKKKKRKKSKLREPENNSKNQIVPFDEIKQTIIKSIANLVDNASFELFKKNTDDSVTKTTKKEEKTATEKLKKAKKHPSKSKRHKKQKTSKDRPKPTTVRETKLRFTNIDLYDSYIKKVNTKTKKIKKDKKKKRRSKSKHIKALRGDQAKRPTTTHDQHDSGTKKEENTETKKTKKVKTTTQIKHVKLANNPDQNGTTTTKKEENTETEKSKKDKNNPSKSKRVKKQETTKDEFITTPTTPQAKVLRFTNLDPYDSYTKTTKKPKTTETIKSENVTKNPSKSKHKKTQKQPTTSQKGNQTEQPATSQKNDQTKPTTLTIVLKSPVANDKIHKVKDDPQVTEFTVHILRQNLNVFETIKNKVDDKKTKRKIDSLSRSYKEKFTDFVLDTRNQTVKTRLGTQKVVLNTIGTSQRILNRLINYLTGDLSKKSLRYDGIENVIHSEVNKEIEMEYQHACKKFGICRRSDGFQKFIMDVITELIKNDDNKLRRANDVLTEVVKNADFKNVIDSRLQKKFDKGISNFETMDMKILKATYTLYRNAIGLRNRPIAVMDGVDATLVNKTVAFMDLIDTFDANIKPTDANVKTWNEIKHNLSQWTMGATTDIQSTIEQLINHIADETNMFDRDVADNVNEQLKVMLKSDKRYDYF